LRQLKKLLELTMKLLACFVDQTLEPTSLLVYPWILLLLPGFETSSTTKGETNSSRVKKKLLKSLPHQLVPSLPQALSLLAAAAAAAALVVVA
jgi:hypothetical protein